MQSITIERRFRGPPNSANGGYVCGLLAKNIDGGAEITLLAPPPLDMPLRLLPGENGGVQLFEEDTLLATGRAVSVDVTDVPAVSFDEAEQATRLTPYDEHTHVTPTCFVCGPSRAYGDGLRIHAGPAPQYEHAKAGVFAASWIPHCNLAAGAARVAQEFVWAALDCPTAYACAGARHLGMNGVETILLGRMSARIHDRPLIGERCVLVAWPTGREGRKLFADGALLGSRGRMLAITRTTWILVGRNL
jgi:hypothetical protein